MATDLVVGKGRVYFDLFEPNSMTPTGERYFGNTPEFTLSSSTETLDHYDSDAGVRVKDQSVTVEETLTGNFTTDHMSLDNIGLFFGGDPETLTVAAGTGIENTLTVRKGRYYQLGVTSSVPQGARNISSVVVSTVGGTPTTIAPLNNYEVDLVQGRIYIEEDAAVITDDQEIKVTFNIASGSRKLVIGKGKEIRGAVRFIGTNEIGTKKDYYFPYVKLSPNGDFALKSDEWQSVSFSLEILKKDATTERIYIEQR